MNTRNLNDTPRTFQDRDIRYASPRGPRCGLRAGEYTCTRHDGHSGEHVAHTSAGRTIVATWDTAVVPREDFGINEAFIDCIRARTTGRIDDSTSAYITDGGTYVLASPPEWTDDRRPHDLVAIHPSPLDGSHVTILRATVNPQFVSALRAALDH